MFLYRWLAFDAASTSSLILTFFDAVSSIMDYLDWLRPPGAEKSVVILVFIVLANIQCSQKTCCAVQRPDRGRHLHHLSVINECPETVKHFPGDLDVSRHVLGILNRGPLRVSQSLPGTLHDRLDACVRNACSHGIRRVFVELEFRLAQDGDAEDGHLANVSRQRRLVSHGAEEGVPAGRNGRRMEKGEIDGLERSWCAACLHPRDDFGVLWCRRLRWVWNVRKAHCNLQGRWEVED